MRLTSRERLQYHLAWALFWLLAFVAVFGPYLMPHQIDASQKTPYLVVQDHGVSKMINAPFPPSADHWFGTDHRGLDVLSLLLNGGRYTLGFALVVTLTRFLIAVPLGLYVGTTGRGRGLLDTLGSLFSSVPLLLILFPMFFGITRALQINNGLNADDPRLLLFTQLLFGALVLLGVFQPAQQFAERAVFYSGKLYITASRSLGASNTRLVFRHLVPHLRPEILFTFLTDFAQVLFLVGQLAVMSIFLGGGEIYTDEATNLFILLTHTGEWGGMIAYGAKYLRLYPWVVIPSTVFLTAAILILSNFSQHLQKRFARPHLYRSAPLYKNKPRLALVAAAVAVCVAVVTVLPNKSPGAIRTTAAVGGELGHDPSSEAMRYQLEKVSGEFMNLLKRGNWDYAQSYIQGKLGESLTPYKMFEPFNLWLHALNKLDYRYVGIGTITTAKGGRYENPYDVELLIATPDGQKETWHLQMSVGRVARVLAGYGGPKLDLADGDAPVLLNQEQREKITHATAEQFMKLLQANDWEAAAKLYQAEEPLPPGVIPDPFDKWLEALSAHRYEFVATDKPSRYYGSLRTGDTVIVKVKNLKSGSVANWTVNVLVQPDGKTAKITYGRGTPAKS